MSFKDIEDDSGGCFKAATLWNTPADQVVTIVANQKTEITGAYASSYKTLKAGFSERGAAGSIILMVLLAVALNA